jgi:hypothetical protein
MSEIPFVNRLGDAIERSAAAHIAGRRGRIRRRITLGALGFLVAATGVAAASGVFSSPERLASTGIGCYERASLTADVSVLSTGEQTPIETCRRVLRSDVPLVACADEAVHVFPGGPGTCEQLGLEPLPRAYTAARQRVNAFAREVMALEQRIDCLPPREFARRVDALLEHSGWTGWRTWLRLDVEAGPCGSVSNQGGDGRRTIDGSLDVEARRVLVVGTAARSTMDLLYSPGGLFIQLDAASRERCLSRAQLEALVRRRTDRAVRFEGPPSGCGTVADVRPAADGHGIVVALQG